MKQPVSDAYVFTNLNSVLVSNQIGKIQINEAFQHMHITHVSYYELHANAPFNDTLFLQAKPILGETVLVLGERTQQKNTENYQDFSVNHALEQQLRQIEGLQLVQRGAFAWEPMIRGLSDQRLSVSVDGMRIYAACTDKMDPPTAYIETEHLQQIIIKKEGNAVNESGNGFAGIHLKSQEARFLHKSSQLSTGYRVQDAYRFISFSGNSGWKNQAIRYTLSYKKADDFQAAEAQTVSGSGYAKINSTLNHRMLWQKRIISTSFMYDDAWDMGFPVLLMDATRARAFMARHEWQFLEKSRFWKSSSVMTYLNTIHHKMDDYGRDVTQRSVMKNMYMPMEGTTQTWGITTKLNEVGFKQLNLNFEWVQSKANGFMLMEPLDANIAPMYLDNLSDVVTQELKLGADFKQPISETVELQLSASGIANRIVTLDRPYGSYFEDLYNRILENPIYIASQAQLKLSKHMSSLGSLSFVSNWSTRPPNHNERFSHYVYNYVDGNFYEGNPWLSKERSWANEIKWQREGTFLSSSVSLFHRNFDSYIAGIPNETLSSDFYSFMTYENVGKAYLFGFESRFLITLEKKSSLDIRTSFTRGRLIDLNDNMPFIAPLSGLIRFEQHSSLGNWITTFEWAGQQTRAAKRISLEDQTNSWYVVNLEWQQHFVNNKWMISLEVQNVFDRFIVRHVSLGNLPDRGRTLGLNIRYSW